MIDIVSVCVHKLTALVLGPSETGQIILWEHGSQESYHSFRHPKRLLITGLAWHPKVPAHFFLSRQVALR
jgi:hypothetical protein